MSIAERPAPAAAPEPAPAGLPPPAPRASLYRTVWRWHFYAGLLVAPVLLAVAVTGGLYVFRDELEPLVYPRLMVVTPRADRVTYQAVVDAAAAADPGAKPQNLEIDRDPARSAAVRTKSPGDHWGTVYVDPYTGEVLGRHESKAEFFGVVLDIHRRLFLGTTGRVLVETATCWTIVLLATGLYLWFPRARDKVRGVFVPRLGGPRYRALRDLHAVPGFFLAGVALLIAGTGLYWTVVWGKGFRAATEAAGVSSRDLFKPVKSGPAGGAAPLPVDAAVAVGRQRWPGHTLTVGLPEGADGSFRVVPRKESGTTFAAVLSVDRYTGSVLAERRPSDLPAAAYVQLWFYPVHVGSAFGLPTKVLAFLACLTLIGLTVTGVWMWWHRRPGGRAGFPRRPDTPTPRWLLAAVVVTGVFLPAVGACALAFLAVEWVVVRGKASSSKPTGQPTC